MRDAATALADAWHGGLTPGVAADSAAWLAEQQHRRGLVFGDRPLCTVLRPRLLTPAQAAMLRVRGGALLSAFHRAAEAAFADPAVLAAFGLADWERRLLTPDPGLGTTSPLGRLDLFLTADGASFRVTEYNAETPAGAAYGDVLGEIFWAMPATRRFLARHHAVQVATAPRTLGTLLDAFARVKGRGEAPELCILDWHEVPTYSEFVAFERYFHAMGVSAFIGDPREATYEGGVLRVGGRRVTLLYKRVLISELVGRLGEDGPVVRAVQDGAAVMVDPFRCKVLHKKASLAVLSDERHAHLFDAGQRAAIAAHVPWTRVVEARTTEVDGRRVDLLPWAREHRERLVLKPNDDYGGTGIVLGWEVDDAAWADALARALTTPTIVQERIHLPETDYPAWHAGALAVAPRVEDTAPFVFDGTRVDGTLTRISTASLVNVTAGGGSTVPTFIAEPR